MPAVPPHHRASSRLRALESTAPTDDDGVAQAAPTAAPTVGAGDPVAQDDAVVAEATEVAATDDDGGRDDDGGGDDGAAEPAAAATNGTDSSSFGTTSDFGGYTFGSDPQDCTFSNDPAAPLCNITAFRCTTSRTALTIPYDYEIHYQLGGTGAGDVDHLLRVVEGSMLGQLAEALGLASCAAASGGRRGRRRLATSSDFSEAQLDRVTGLSLLPWDVVSAEDCRAAPANATGVACRSVKGALTLYTLLTPQESADHQTTLSADERRQLEAAVLGVVGRGMSDGSYLRSAADPAEQVVFLGSSDTSAPNSKGSHGLAIGLALTVVLLVLAGAAAVFFVRSRAKHRKGATYLPDTSSDGHRSESAGDRAESDASSIATRESHNLDLSDKLAVETAAPPASGAIKAQASDIDRSVTSVELAMYDLDALVETTTDLDLGNYNFSFEQGVSPKYESFDKLYDDIGLPKTYDEDSQRSQVRPSGLAYR